MEDNTIVLKITPNVEKGGFNCEFDLDTGIKASHSLQALERLTETLLKNFGEAAQKKGFVFDENNESQDLRNFIASMTIGELFNG